MAGIGPICTNSRDLLKRAEYRSRLTAPSSELEIFCSLCTGRVFYSENRRRLYYVDSPTISITNIIQTVFQGINQAPDIRQLYMDEHELIKAAFCITLSASQKNLILVALRMSGIHIDKS